MMDKSNIISNRVKAKTANPLLVKKQLKEVLIIINLSMIEINLSNSTEMTLLQEWQYSIQKFIGNTKNKHFNKISIFTTY
jgi:hypothetical protein